MGIANPIAHGVESWNAHVQTAARVWQPDAGEGFRAMGLETDPNYLGALALAVLVWAVATHERPATRLAIVAMSVLTVVLSASRTSALAVVIVMAVAGARVWWMRRRAKPPAEIGNTTLMRPAAVVLVAVLVVGVALAGGGMISRLAESASALPDATAIEGSTHFIETLDVVTNGRMTRWIAGYDAWRAHPLGAFMLPDVVVGTHIHNEYLERLVWGGPIMLFAFVFALVWLALRFKPQNAPAFGVSAALAWGLTAVALYATHLPGFATMLFFGIGATAALPEKVQTKKQR